MQSLIGSLFRPFVSAKARISRGSRSESELRDAGQVARIVETVEAHTVAGRFGEAQAIADDALANTPNDRQLQFARGLVLGRWGRHREAREHLLRVEAAGPNDAKFYQTLGLVCFWAGDFSGSERSMRLAIEHDRLDWELLFGLAVALYRQKRYVEAKAAWEEALELNPDNPHCLANLTGCEIELRNLETAEHLARHMVDIAPDNPIAWSNLGVVLDRIDQFPEAIAAFERASQLAVNSNWQDDFLNHAICLLRAVKPREAIALLEARLPGNPNIQAHAHYSLALLSVGRMQEGWDQYEFRWIDGPLKPSRPNFIKPMWIGQDLTNRTILIRFEQGYGDFFQFIRYAKYIKMLAARVLLLLPEALRACAERVDGIDEILKTNAPYPEFDFYVDLLSIPRVFGTDVSSVPAEVPYLHPDSVRRAAWKLRISHDKSLKVGLAWAGSPTHMRDKDRSMRFEMLGALSGLQGVTFYSLQKGPRAAEARADDAPFKVIDLESELNDFADTAALIDALDLVICVDTSISHLAGGLGKPVWLMLPVFNDWRWLEDRDDSVWYPSMRVFRQRRHGDWSDVALRVREELAAVCNGVKKLYAGSDKTTPPVQLTPRAVRWVDGNLCGATNSRAGYFQYLSNGSAGKSIAYYGEYLQEHVDLLSRIVTPGATVLEVASGIGVHSIVLSHRVQGQGHLMLYEGRPLLQQLLRQNLSANGIANVTVMQTRLKGGAVDIAAVGGDEPTSSTEGETIDELRLDKLHLLKINEHSNPTAIIDGAADSLWRTRPYVFSVARDNREADRLAERLWAFSYRTWRLETPLFNSKNFNQQLDDVFGGGTVVALLGIPEETEVDITLHGCVEIKYDMAAN